MFRALQLGDMLCSVPALRALRVAFPAAEITLVGLPWARAFVNRFALYLDRFIEFPGYPGLPEIARPRLAEFPRFLIAVQQRRFDLAIQLHGSGDITNPLVGLFAAKAMVGFGSADRSLDSCKFLAYPEGLPEARRLLSLVECLGARSVGEALEFPITERDRAAFDDIAETQLLPAKQYVCVHPGARDAARRWPIERFARAADALAAQGLTVVLTGSAEEVGLVADVAGRMRARHVNLAGRTDLGALAVLLHGARLLIANDTGISHLAAALETPSVVIFNASEPARWAPVDRARHRVLVRPPAERVVGEAKDLLQRELPHAACALV